MISKEDFWRVLEGYGAGILPAQFIFYIAAVIIVAWLAIRPGRRSSLAANAFLATAFAWIAVIFYLTLAEGMAGSSHGNYIFGAVFIAVSVLFAADLFRGRMRFSIPPAGWRRYTTLTLMLLVFCYPLIGILLGHSATSLIMPGTFPCPTTALALLLLTTALPQVDRAIYILLLICAIPFTPFFQIARYGVYEDTILLAIGVYALILLVMTSKRRAIAMQTN